MNALDKAIEEAGSAAELARRLNVIPSVIGNWRMREQVPAERCIDVENATKGKVTRYELRPDVFGHAPKRERAA